jgi:hypothetical protein
MNKKDGIRDRIIYGPHWFSYLNKIRKVRGRNWIREIAV